MLALTTSGSAISGWTLWNNPDYKLVWVLLASVGALLAIVHKALDVSRKLTDEGSARSQFSSLRIEIESFLNQMRFFPDFSIDEYSKSLGILRKRFADAYQVTKVDPFLTKRVYRLVQETLNKRLQNT